MKVKVFYPAAYGGKLSPQPYAYTVSADIDVVRLRVEDDLRAAHAGAIEVSDLGGAEMVVRHDSANAPLPEVVKLGVNLVFDQDDIEEALKAQDTLATIVETWAKKSRVSGLRGERFYAIEVPQEDWDDNKFSAARLSGGDVTADEIDDILAEEKDVTDVFAADDKLVLKLNVLLGTMIFYNARRATSGFHSEAGHAIDDFNNLVTHVTKLFAGAGIVIEHDQHGELRFNA